MTTISNGSFVVGKGLVGRVDLVVTAGQVPGVEGEVEGTKDHPVARVVRWQDGAPLAGSAKTAVALDDLHAVPPLDGDDHTGFEAALLAHRDHALYSEETQQPETVNLNMIDVAKAYERGIEDWPGAAMTDLSQEEWAVGRVKHLCAVALGREPETNDSDLLHKDHPASTRGETVVVEQSEVDDILASIDEVVAPE